MRMFVAFVASALVMTPAFASSDEAKEPKAEKVCRANKLATGTRLAKKKICKTAEEWAAEDQRNDNNLRDVQRMTR
ncbi:hypothetical protein [Sphingomonas sp. LaA6.9]|uniref:hypothetical protein n=1 Tax=Sphingomonas sp. LaA6.9 TaxID=2919914 RepID=UPI001F4FE665|nr:hypothetical protein [Sphingomonas sp. LaA6.9]MCJ8157423.1 hypothetical protein [Sphingomonas sp. LaA6.9]